jgi:hypothetical protein
VPRSSNRHLVSFVIFSVFVLAFSAFLVVTGYYYLTGEENVTIKSFAPGVPAFFLFFLARKEWRSMRASRNMEKRKKRVKESQNQVVKESESGGVNVSQSQEVTKSSSEGTI